MNSIIKTKQVNITILFGDSVVSFIQDKTPEIRRKIIELYDDQPIINQFPDFIGFIAPKSQISIVAETKRIIISNQEIKEFKARNLENFLILIDYINKLINKDIKAFGFNYSFFINITGEDSDEIKRLLEIINLEKLGIKNEKLIGGGINIAYEEDEIRIQMVSSPVYSDDTKKMIGQDIQTNIHFYKNKLDAFSDLSEKFSKFHDEMEKKINSIFDGK